MPEEDGSSRAGLCCVLNCCALGMTAILAGAAFIIDLGLDPYQPCQTRHTVGATRLALVAEICGIHKPCRGLPTRL